MGKGQPRWLDAGLDQLAPQPDDDELITVGEPIYDVVEVTVVGPLTLRVRFEDGVEGTVRFDTSALTGFYAKLSDPDYFTQAGILHGTVSWPDEDPDLSPTVTYEHLKRDGAWVLN